MAIVDLDEVIAFLKPNCYVPEAGEDGKPKPGTGAYARIRAGRSKRTADGSWRRDLAGADPRALAQEVAERHLKLTKGEKAWLEIVERQKSERVVVDTLPLGSAPDKSEDAERSGGIEDIDPEAGSNAMVVALIGAIVQTNGQVMSRLGGVEDRYHDLLTKHIEVSATAAGQAATLDWIEKHGLPGSDDNAAMEAAIAQVAPYIGPALAAMLVGKAKKDKIPLSPEARADRAITDLNELADASPDILRARGLALMALGQKLQGLA